MKKAWVILVLLFGLVWAQGSVQALRRSFSYVLRVAEAPCPAQFGPASSERVCYRHGYADVFDLKEALTSLVSGPDDYLEPWRVVTLEAEGEAVEAFRARYRLNEREIALTYVSESLLVLEVGDLPAAP